MSTGRFPAGKIEARGEQVPCEVDDYGHWFASVGDKEIYRETKEELRAAVMTATLRRAVKVEVPFTQWTYQGWQTGIASGVHAGNGSVLARLDGPRRNSSAQLRGHSGSEFYRPLSQDEKDEIGRLRAAASDARDALAAYTRPRSIRLEAKVEEAIKTAAAAQRAADLAARAEREA